MRKKAITIAVSSILSFALILGTGAVYGAASQTTLEHEVIIMYNNEQGKDTILKDSVEIKHVFETIPAVSATVTNTDLKEMLSDPNIAYIERNIPFQMTGESLQTESILSIPAEQSQWSFQAVKPAKMWTKGYTGTGIKVAVIDSGISAHSELTVLGGISTVNYTASYNDDNGHGTHVAGIIAAKKNDKGMVGLAPDIQLYAVKALDQKGDGTLQDVLEGIDWAIQNQMDIINLSLGTEYVSDLLEEMVDLAYSEGIIMVGSAGNSGPGTNTISYPAKYDNVIAVAAIDDQQALGDFSSTGAENEVAAPGVDIVSTSNSGGYAMASGTSQAAPHVTGMLALLKQEHPEMSNVQLREYLRNYAIDLGAPGRDDEFGYGFVTFAQEFDLTAPAEVSSFLVGEVTSTSANVSWVNPLDADFAKVNLYANGSFTGTVTGTTYTYTGLSPNTHYVLQARTVDLTGNESAGNEAIITTAETEPTTIDDITAPAEVSNLVVAEATYAALRVSWTNPLDNDFAKALVFLDGSYVGETLDTYYNLTNLLSEHLYTIVIKTQDIHGNVSIGTILQAATQAQAPVISSPDPIVTNPEPVVTNPDPIISNPDPIISNPDPIISNPDPVVTNPDPVVPIQIPDVQTVPVTITNPPTGGSAGIVAVDTKDAETKAAQAALEQAKKSLTMIHFIEAKLNVQALSDADIRKDFQLELEKLRLELGPKELLAKNSLRASVPINVSMQAAMKSADYKYIDLTSVKPGENVFVVNSKGEVVKDIQVYILWNRIFIKPMSGSFAPKEMYTLIIDKTVKGKPTLSSDQSFALSHPLTMNFTTR